MTDSQCKARSAEGDRCTRKKGHEPPHISVGADIAIWPASKASGSRHEPK